MTASRFRVVLPPRRAYKLAEFALFEQPRVDRAELKAGFGVARDYYALTTDAAATDAGVAPGAVIDLTAKMQPDGTLDWTPPKGNWRVLRFGASLLGKVNHPAPPEATGLEVDKLDGPAVRRYLETYIGMYRDAAGPELVGKRGVQALVTDSTEIGALNWTPQMIAQFKRLRGYDPTPWLPTVTGTLIGTRAESDAFLYDLRRTIADLMSSEHYGTIAKVAHEAGLTVYGEALEDKRPVLGDDMAMRSHADIPMSAMWVWPRNGGIKITYLAEQLIWLSGKVPGRDIQIVYTGLRPGEKLFEELFHEQEPYEHTKHEKILLAHPRQADWESLGADLREAERAVRRYDTKKIQQILFKLVPELKKSTAVAAPDAGGVVPIHRAR